MKKEEILKIKLELKDEMIGLYKSQIEIMKFVTDIYNRIEIMENKNG
tara:strand:- start:96 stop:236 length:141 start_codon:yes stop_codon:yes gene_type:complete